MPTNIVYIDASGVEQDFLIQEAVVRIGGSSVCELFLDGEEDLVGVLRYNGHAYSLSNRSRYPVIIASKAIGAGESSPWPSKQEMVLASGRRLRMESNGDPGPKRNLTDARRFEDADREFEEQNPGVSLVNDRAKVAVEESKKKQSRQTMQLAVIGGCIVIIFLMLAGPAIFSSAHDPQVVADFDEIVNEINTELSQSREDSERIWNSFMVYELQTARALELRGSSESAVLHYRSLRDQIASRLQHEPDRTLDSRVYEFVLQRLQSN